MSYKKQQSTPITTEFCWSACCAAPRFPCQCTSHGATNPLNRKSMKPGQEPSSCLRPGADYRERKKPRPPAPGVKPASLPGSDVSHARKIQSQGLISDSFPRNKNRSLSPDSASPNRAPSPVKLPPSSWQLETSMCTRYKLLLESIRDACPS